MEKSVNSILDKLDKAFELAEKDLLKFHFANETDARQKVFIELIDMFGTWKEKGDCFPSEWIRNVYFKESSGL
mgnify:CR=1 FL=1